MKRFTYLFLLIGIALTSCNKPEAVLLEQEVIFKATAFETSLKSTEEAACDHDQADYAIITIEKLDESGDPIQGSSEDIISEIFYLNGLMYSNSLKLDPGSYQVTDFVLMNNGTDNIMEPNGDTSGDGEGDVIVYATPETGSPYALLVASLPQAFSVTAFMKNEVNLQVLCFEPSDYDLFGFSWFAIDYTIVPSDEIFFFGDICTKYFADYEADIDFYAAQTGDLSHDMPAIFVIDVFEKLSDDSYSLIESYNNEAWLGEGEPLRVPHPDDAGIANEEFKFVLSIRVKIGAGFGYKEFHTWTITDNNPIDSGDDNVVDFVLGSCVPDADLVLPPYMNLPETTTLRTFDLNDNTNPLEDTTYFKVELSEFKVGGVDVTDAGFDIKTVNYGVFCADVVHVIPVPDTYYSMNVYSSLYPDAISSVFNTQKAVLDRVNWLGNHLDQYELATWKDIQNAIWLITAQINVDGTYTTDNLTVNGDVGAPSDLAKAMRDDAVANGDGYLPPVGGFAAVLFGDDAATLQLIFTLVDP